MSNIEDILKTYETKSGALLMSKSDRQYLISVLQSVYDFASIIGMQECFEKNFDQVLFCVNNSHVILDCLNPNSRYCPDMQKAVKLFVLIIALQNRCTNIDNIDQKKLTSLVDIKNIESLIDNNLSRDRTLEASLLFFSSILNELVFQDKTDQYINFQKEHFDINEILITESALMSVLGTFQLSRELKEQNISITGSTKQFFKLFYIFYSDVYFCLSHDKFSDILKNFFIKYGSDARQSKFFFEFMFRILNDLKPTDLLNKESFYQTKLLHPFETIQDLYEIPFTFYDRIQKEKTDYTVNYDKYAKNLKDILYYVWIEANHAYLLALSFDENENIKTEDFVTFVNNLFQVMIDAYYDTDMLPTFSVLGYFVPQGNSSTTQTSPIMSSLMGSSLFSGAFDKILDIAKKTNIIQNETILNALNNDMIKTAASGFFQNMGKNVGTSVQTNVVKKFVTFNFSKIASSILLFWKTFCKSHSIKDLALNGNNGDLMNKVVDMVKQPAINIISKGVDALPFGSLLNSQNVGQILNVALNQIHGLVGSKQVVTDSPFTSGEQIVSDFANSTNPIKNVEDAF